MSKFRSSVASALSFAHLAGLNFKSSKAKGEDSDDNEQKKGSKADEDEQETDKKKGRRAQKEDESDDDYADYNDDQDEKDKKSKSAKSAKADDDDEDADDDGDDDDIKEKNDDDDEDEMRGKSAAAGARRRERSRCAAIMGSKHAGSNVVLAANLAFNTSMTRKQALAVLRDTPSTAANGRNLDRSARRNPSLGAGGEQSPNSTAAVTSSWDRAMSRVNPSRR